MSNTFFPNSKQAIPKINVERKDEKQTEKEQLNNITENLERTEQSGPASGLSGEKQAIEKIVSQNEEIDGTRKDAQVWKTYVQETDRSDKELVEGRNSFIIESLGDLKPNSAESSTQALLLAMSQALVAIGNNQSVSLSTTSQPADVTFAASHSAVIVNILWLLSLSLSVAVSLIAMLAKEWCYKFVSNRVGPMYDQARRRQKKWNGIEAWRLQEVLGFLPCMMHTALLLFAVGLCIYLWDVHPSVAIPVTIVTAVATCVYSVATLVPLIAEFCPYSTPVTPIIAATPNLITVMKHSLVKLGVTFKAYLMSRYQIYHPWYLEPETLWECFLERIANWILSENVTRNPQTQMDDDPTADMDIVTSQMLAWMIENCEDRRSVDIALQAIASVKPQLDWEPLQKCNALGLVSARLDSCIRL
ncbi:hypothetical protein RhiJN_12952 [Ceratobasidium sp. AG-Ba]|nr:hypothetical protein RhiJN_12952 [Ceratobasidium sp. AG-Ba]